MAFTRRNAWNNGGTFDNPDLLWYARAVRVMKSKPVSDATSWWFYAAIHGQYLTLTADSGPIPTDFPNWTKIKSIPESAVATLPSSDNINIFWDQCQHGSWFFIPWHRGYLVALEDLLRQIIVNDLKGPEDWALPYWNYLENEQNGIPPAFMDATLPDKTPNPLYIPERYGPQGNGQVSIIVGQVKAANDNCQSKPDYTHIVDGYGGTLATSEFEHDSNYAGRLEKNPHNFVHLMVGGYIDRNWDDGYIQRLEGLMTDPNTAALDPIFYIHHCNIDRMWAAWNETGGHPNPSETEWLNGPAGTGQRHFAMSMDAKGTPWQYTPDDVKSTTVKYYGGTTYAFTYDNLALTSGESAAVALTMQDRLLKLGVSTDQKAIAMAKNNDSELVGSSNTNTPITLNDGATEIAVQLDNPTWKSVANKLKTASATALPDEVYLQLDNVKGIHNSNYLSVYVNDVYVETVALFGIRKASAQNSAHGGSGLTFRFSISKIVDDMHLSGDIDASSLKVKIETENPTIKGAEITVGSISVYRLSQ